MANPLLTLDSDIPLPDHNQLLTLSIPPHDPRYVVLKDNISDLKASIREFKTLRTTIRALEAGTEVANRDADFTNRLRDLRNELVQAETQINSTAQEAARIADIHSELKPTLAIYPQPARANQLDWKDLRSYMGPPNNSPDANVEAALISAWKRLSMYAIRTPIEHEDFVAALLTCVPHEVQEFLYDYRDKPLSTIASVLAERFISKTSITDSELQIKTFTRLPNETISQAVARFRGHLDKTLKLEPVAERDSIRYHKLSALIFKIVSPKVREVLEKAKSTHRMSGSTISLDQLLYLATDEESRQNSHSDDKVSLFNTDVLDSNPVNSRLDQIEHTNSALLDSLQQLTLSVNTLSAKTDKPKVTFNEPSVTRSGRPYQPSSRTPSPPRQLTPSRQTSRPTSRSPSRYQASGYQPTRSHSPAPRTTNYGRQDQRTQSPYHRGPSPSPGYNANRNQSPYRPQNRPYSPGPGYRSYSQNNNNYNRMGNRQANPNNSRYNQGRYNRGPSNRNNSYNRNNQQQQRHPLTGIDWTLELQREFGTANPNNRHYYYRTPYGWSNYPPSPQMPHYSPTYSPYPHHGYANSPDFRGRSPYQYSSAQFSTTSSSMPRHMHRPNDVITHEELMALLSSRTSQAQNCPTTSIHVGRPCCRPQRGNQGQTHTSSDASIGISCCNSSIDNVPRPNTSPTDLKNDGAPL